MEGSLRRSVQASQVGSEGAALFQGQQGAGRWAHALDPPVVHVSHLESISSATANAMGDVGNTQQRAAARLGVALAMERCGDAARTPTAGSGGISPALSTSS